MKIALRALVLFACAAVVSADKVILKDGRSYEGVVLEETETSVKIKTAKATLTVPRDQVVSIEKSSGPLQEREKKLAALDPSKPADYLAVANWMTGKGKEAYDLPTLRRLLSIAAKLDPALAYESQMLLARTVEETNRREAAMAYARAQLAKPGDPEVRVRLNDLRNGLEADARREMEQLAAALDLVVAQNYAEALPRLQKTAGLAMSEQAQAQIGMSMAILTNDIASRVKCKTCDGVGDSECPGCGGDGLIICSACGGSGTKKTFTAGKEEEKFGASVCRTCYGMGGLLCVKCKAERDIAIWYCGGSPSAKVRAKAGHEADALKCEIDLIKYVHKSCGAWVSSIQGGTPCVGGRTPCGTCQGIKFAPPSTQPPLDKIRLYSQDVSNRAKGQKPYDAVPQVTESFDRTVISDGSMKYKDGKWVK